MQKLFGVQKAGKFVGDALAALEAQHAAQVEHETAPDKLEAAKRRHERFAVLLRQKLTWDALEPLAIQAYGKRGQVRFT